MELCDQVSVINEGSISEFQDPGYEIQKLSGKLWKIDSNLVLKLTSTIEMKLISVFFRKGKEEKVYYIDSPDSDLAKYGFEPVEPSLKHYLYCELSN